MPSSSPYPGPTPRVASRRAVLLGGLGAAAAAALAGCSSSGSAGTASPPASPAGTQSPASAGFPVTLPGKEGAVTVTSAPKRVVAAGYLRDTDLALALGAPLVGAARNTTFPSGLAPWQHAPEGLTLFDTTNGMPFEQVAALQPDLIAASDDYTLTKDYASLAKIAPTLSYLQGVGADSWQTMTTRAGTVLGQSSQAATLITSVQGQIAKARAGNTVLAGKTFTFGPVSSLSSIFTINDPADASAAFFSQLGMTLSPKVTTLPDSSTPRRSQISPEQLSLLDADVVILTYPDASIQAKFEAQPVFKQLTAVKRGAYIALGMADAVAVAFPSVLSIPYGLQVVVPRLASAASKAGGPA